MTGVELWHQLRQDPRTRGLSLTVVDRQEEHSYIPLIHERLCERVDERTMLPTREWLERDSALSWVTGEVTAFDPDRREVTLADGARRRGRHVVVALGSSVAAPPRVPGSEHFLAFKLEEERRQSERALVELLTRSSGSEAPHVLIVGGGITGVELAGELAHLAEERPEGWRAPRVTLVDGGARLLAHHAGAASRIACESLLRQGVEVRLETRLEGAEATSATLSCRGETEQVPADLMFWAGGVRPPLALAALGLPLTSDGWLRADATLRPDAERWPTIFAAGDVCRIHGPDDAVWRTMQRAIECIWQAKVVQRGLVALAANQPLPEHTLREDFPHGVSMGADSMVTFGSEALELGGFAVWFRRFLMRKYLARYEPRRS